jgi:hypothetical protein
MATPTTWTDEQVFAVAEAAFLCGVATGDRAFGKAWIGPRTEDFMPLVDQACNMPSRAGRRKALRFAAGVMAFFCGQVERIQVAEPTITPEQILAEAGISNRRQARYQRRMASLLAGRP